jgi:hypothetical protein
LPVSATILGDVGGSGQCTFDIGFGYISIRSGDQLYYWDGTTLTHVTDTDLGPVIDSMWIDGYNMTTDGENIIVTESTTRPPCFRSNTARRKRIRTW